MLSAETAAGKYPVEVVETMATIVAEADLSEQVELDLQFVNRTFDRVDQSIAYGALFTAYHLRCAAICALTESGSTTLWMSRHDVDIPIYALTASVATARRLALYRNVRPLHFPTLADRDASLAAAERLLLERGVVRRGDLIVHHGRRANGAGGRHQYAEDRAGRRACVSRIRRGTLLATPRCRGERPANSIQPGRPTALAPRRGSIRPSTDGVPG